MAGDEVRIRRVESEVDIALANKVAAEYGDWTSSQARLKYGVVIDTNHSVGVGAELHTVSRIPATRLVGRPPRPALRPKAQRQADREVVVMAAKAITPLS